MNVPDSLAHLVFEKAGQVSDFAELSTACGGAWPALLRDLLDGRHDHDSRRLLASAKARSTRVVTDRRLPLAHPLDGDWRFTAASANETLDVLLDATPSSRDILLVAMPTVALAAHDRGLTHRIVIASRAGDPVDTALRAAIPTARFDDLQERPPRPFGTIGIDPPWYDDVAAQLIDASLAQASDDGAVFVCIPDRFTLPSAAPNLVALRTDPEKMGLATSVLVGSLRYATPFFEIRCLRALGITNVDPCWRTGLLLACRPIRTRRPRRALKLQTTAEWRETGYGPIRIWTRTTQAVSLDKTHIEIAKSISRSDPARSVAQLWTSGNTTASGLTTLAPSDQDTSVGRPSVHADELTAALNAEVTAVEQTVDFE